ncbi:MAG: DUF2934 domain-containing protein [Steroidobacteraceae bacterium]
MEITPVIPAVRTSKVRTAKPAASKSNSAAAKSEATTMPRKRKPTVRKTATSEPAIIDSDMMHMIATAAYFMAEQRNFAPGHELQDWLAAEHMIRSNMSRK